MKTILLNSTEGNPFVIPIKKIKHFYRFRGQTHLFYGKKSEDYVLVKESVTEIMTMINSLK